MTITRLSAIAIAVTTLGCIDRPMTVFERLQDARQLTSETLVAFTKAADASNRVVMVTEEDAAAVSAKEAEQAREQVQTAVDKLKALLVDLEYANEVQLLEEFNKRFADYSQLDRQILAVAVESSNLKAQRLAFGPAQQQADALASELHALAPLTGPAQSQAQALTATVTASVREIQALQAPHIAEASDTTMASLERRMSTAESSARQALEDLQRIEPAGAAKPLAGAAAAFAEFMRLNAEIVTLSRQNSNVHALALSLGQKRALVAACEESLRALEDALKKREFKATK